MATTIKSSYGSNNQAITCTITSLANGGARASTALDNTSNLFLDVLVVVKIKSNASTASGWVDVYAYGTADGGTTYSEDITGTDGGVTLTNPPNVVWIGKIAVTTTSTTYTSPPFSVARGFSGILPDHWGIVVVNNTGGTLDASVGSSWYQGIYTQAVP